MEEEEKRKKNYESKSERIFEYLLKTSAKTQYINEEMELKIIADMRLRFGISTNKAKEYIDDMIITGRFKRFEVEAGDESEG